MLGFHPQKYNLFRDTVFSLCREIGFILIKNEQVNFIVACIKEC